MFVRVQVPPAVLFRREDREIEGRWKASFFCLWWCVINSIRVPFALTGRIWTSARFPQGDALG